MRLVAGKGEILIKIAIMIPSLNEANNNLKGIEETCLFKIFLKSFINSYDDSGKYNFKIYLVIDRIDPIYKREYELKKLKENIGLIKYLDIEFIWSDGISKGHLTAMWNRAFECAYHDNCDYFYQAGDDIAILDKGWESAFINALIQNDNMGVSGPFDYGRYLFE